MIKNFGPCRKCGSTDRHSSGGCRPCQKAAYEANKDRRHVQMKARRERLKEADIDAYRSGRREERRKGNEKAKAADLEAYVAKRRQINRNRLERRKADPDAFAAYCREASARARARYLASDPDGHRAQMAQYMRDYLERLRADPEVWEDHLRRRSERRQEDKAKNPEKYAIQAAKDHVRLQAWREKQKAEDPEQYRRKKNLYLERMREEDPECHRQWLAKVAERARRRYAASPKYNLHGRMSAMVASTLKRGGGKGGQSWTKLVGYTAADLQKHLQKTMPAGFSWQDYMDARLHIDHIIPVSAFHFSQPSDHDFQRCWALKNLRLLPASENMSKGAKLAKPFQPSLL